MFQKKHAFVIVLKALWIDLQLCLDKDKCLTAELCTQSLANTKY